MNRVLPLILVSLQIVTACQQWPDQQTPQSPRLDMSEFCQAQAFSHLVGEPASAAAEIPGLKRVLRPGDMKTEDHRPNRTNVMVDNNGQIKALTCG